MVISKINRLLWTCVRVWQWSMCHTRTYVYYSHLVLWTIISCFRLFANETMSRSSLVQMFRTENLDRTQMRMFSKMQLLFGYMERDFLLLFQWLQARMYNVNKNFCDYMNYLKLYITMAAYCNVPALSHFSEQLMMTP